MKRLAFLLLFVSLIALAQGQDKVYLPKNLAECHRTLDTLLADSTQQKIMAMTESEFTSGAHFGLGMWIRNNWGLWGGSRLQDYFENKGLHHPDDMSGIILTTYWRYKHGQPLGVKKEIKKYKEYWKQYPQPTNPTPIKGINNNHSLEENVAFLHLPVIDSVTGARAELHHPGRADIDTFALAYWRKHVAEPAPPPVTFHQDNQLQGHIHSIRTTYYDYYSRKKTGEELILFDSLGNKIFGKAVSITEMGDTTIFIRSTLYDNEGWPRMTIQIYDSSLSEVYLYTRTSNGYNEYNPSQLDIFDYIKRIFDTNFHALLPAYTDTSILFGISILYDREDADMVLLLACRPDIFDSVVSNTSILVYDTIAHVLDSAGREIYSVSMEGSTKLTQYDSQGREVTYLEYNKYDDTFYLHEGGTVTVYDDKQNVQYTFNGNSKDALVKYFDRHGSYTGARYKDHRHRRSPHHYRWRYDSHGNWTSVRQKHRLIARREIEYWQ